MTSRKPPQETRWCNRPHGDHPNWLSVDFSTFCSWNSWKLPQDKSFVRLLPHIAKLPMATTGPTLLLISRAAKVASTCRTEMTLAVGDSTALYSTRCFSRSFSGSRPMSRTSRTAVYECYGIHIETQNLRSQSTTTNASSGFRSLKPIM